MFLLRNKKKISLNYPQYPLLSGALRHHISSSKGLEAFLYMALLRQNLGNLKPAFLQFGHLVKELENCGTYLRDYITQNHMVQHIIISKFSASTICVNYFGIENHILIPYKYGP